MAGNYDGSIRINTKVDTKSFNTGASGIVSGLKSIAKYAAAAFSIGAMVKFGAQAVELASDIAEVDNVVSKSFGNMRGQMDALANESIKSLGMSRLTAYQTGSTFMAMGKSMLDSSEDAATMALELTKLTGNMASFYNKSQDLVSLALKSVYTGETETLKQYGIVMTEVNLKQFALEQGITKAYSAMTQSEKVMLRYKYVMQQTAFIGDDFLDTQDSWANQTRILKEQWKEFLTVVGTGLVTVLTPVVKGINAVISALITFANAVGAVMSKVFGIKAQSLSVGGATEDVASGYDAAAESAEGYGEAASDAADETAKAAKKMKGSLSNIDELNTINTNADSSGSGSGSGAGGVGGASITGTDLPAEENAIDGVKGKLGELQKFVQEIQSALSKGWDRAWSGLDISDKISNIQDSLKTIGTSISEIFTAPEVQGAFKNWVLSWAESMATITGSVLSIGLSIASGIFGGIEQFFTENTGKIIEYIAKMFDISSEVATIKANFALAVADIFSVFEGENFQGLVANILGIFSEAFIGLTTLSAETGRDILDALTKPIIDNSDKIKTALDTIIGFFKDFAGIVKDLVGDIVDGVLEIYDSHIKPFIQNIADGVSEIVGTLLDGWNTYISPFLNNVIKDLKAIYKDYLKPIIKNVCDIIGNIIDIVNELWKNVLQPVLNWVASKIMPVLSPILTKIWNAVGGKNGAITKVLSVIKSITDVISTVTGLVRDIVKGDWQSVWNTAKNIVKKVVNGIIGILEKMVNKAIDALNALLAPLRKVAQMGAAVINALFGQDISVPDKFPHVNIPRLATGAVIPPNSPFLAMLGDQKSGTNIETPLDTMILAFKTALAESGGVGGQTIVRIVPDDRNIFKVVMEQEKHNYNMTGNAVFAH